VVTACQDRSMSDADLPDDDSIDIDELYENEVSALDRTRADYTGVDLDDEFQPVDELELAEEGALLDDPDTLERD
jgi:hypothetical protein